MPTVFELHCIPWCFFTIKIFDMPPSSLVKKTRSCLSDVQRKEICCYHKDHLFAKQQDIADKFQIRYPNLSLDRSTVSKVLSKKDHYLHLETTNQSQRVF